MAISRPGKFPDDVFFVAVLGNGLLIALAVAFAYWVFRRAQGSPRRFPWLLVAVLWLPASLGVFGFYYATWES